MQLLYDAIICGLLTALTWLGLVWMSPDRPIASSQGWVKGVGIVAIANTLAWFLLGLLGLKMIWFWAIFFVLINAAIARLIFPLCQEIRIPPIWAWLIHPLIIAAMSVLLGGAIGFL